MKEACLWELFFGYVNGGERSGKREREKERGGGREVTVNGGGKRAPFSGIEMKEERVRNALFLWLCFCSLSLSV